MTSQLSVMAFHIGSLFLILPMMTLGAPVWLAVALIVSPIALAMLGLTLQEEARRPWVFRVGNALERGGALLYVLLWVGSVVVGFVEPSKEVWVGVAGGSLGLLSARAIWKAACRRARGLPTEFDDPFRWGDEVATGTGRTVRGFVAVVGVDTIGMGLVSLAFTVVAAFLLARKGPTPQGLTTLLFFGGCTAIAVQDGLTRWATFVPGVHQNTQTLARRIMIVGASMMVVALFAFALAWPGVAMWLRVLLGSAGVLVVGAVGWAAFRRWCGRPSHDVSFVQEGLQMTLKGCPIVWRWDDIEGLRVVDVSGNVAIGVDLELDAEPLSADSFVSNHDEAAASERFESVRARNRSLYGVDLVFVAIHLPEPPGAWLERALRFVGDPDARLELVPFGMEDPFAS